MKLTIVLLTACCLHVTAGTVAQNVTLSVKNGTLKSVFLEINRQTGYNFVYNKRFAESAKPVTLDVKQATLPSVLQECFRDQPFTYEILDKTIIIKEKTQSPKNAVEQPTPPPANIDVTITVVSSEGQTLEGASIFLKGEKKGIVTDINGHATLKNVSPDATIVISFTGYANQEIQLSNRSSIGVRLQVSTNELDQVQIIAYGSVSKRLNTGNVSTVKGEDIQKQPVTDPLMALEGRVPGLYIQQASGIPGAYSSVLIRGQNSLSNTGGKLYTANDPLYIIDGVPFESASITNTFGNVAGGAVGNPTQTGAGGKGPRQGLSPFNTLNPADIEQIDVLKDASATAIYGSRGANGVILITTKKGKAGQTKVDVNVYTGADKVAGKLKLLNTQQYLEMRNEAFKNDGATPGINDYDVNGTWDVNRYTDWQKVLIGNTARFTNAQLSISGGNTNTQFMINGGYSTRGTVYPGDYSDTKASVHFSLNNKSANGKFESIFSAGFVNDDNHLPNVDLTSNILLAPNAPAIYDANGNLNWQIQNGIETWENPLAYTMQNDRANTNNLIGSLNLAYHLLPGLDLRSNFGYNYMSSQQMNLSPGTAQASTILPGNLLNARKNNHAISQYNLWNIEPQITYRKKVGKGVFDVLVGSTFLQSISQSRGYSASGFSSDALISNPGAATTLTAQGATYTERRYAAVFGRVSYNWAEKYLVNITARRDGSSRFGPDKQWGNFGAAGAGWIFSNEQFFKDRVAFLSFGKLRASYGTSGNDQITDYQYLSTYTPVTSTYQGISGLSPTRIANPDFAWEQNNQLEVGMELGFMKNNVIFSASYYNKRSGNQLVGYPLPYTAGFNTVQYNLPAVIQNSGLELTLSTTNIKSKYFTWKSDFNITIPRNKLVSYPNIETSSFVYTYTVGQPLQISQTIYHFTGLDPQTGTYTFATKNSNGVPSAIQDWIISKPITQLYYGGFHNSFFYKGFQLDFLLQFVKQNGLDGQTSPLPGLFSGTGAYGNQSVDVMSRWQKPGDITRVEKFTQQDVATYTAFQNLLTSDYLISDAASFIRLKNLAVSWQLPTKWQQKARLQNAKIYLQGQNLFVITRYKGLDPETGGGLGLPPMRTITAGIQITL